MGGKKGIQSYKVQKEMKNAPFFFQTDNTGPDPNNRIVRLLIGRSSPLLLALPR